MSEEKVDRRKSSAAEREEWELIERAKDSYSKDIGYSVDEVKDHHDFVKLLIKNKKDWNDLLSTIKKDIVRSAIVAFAGFLVLAFLLGANGALDKLVNGPSPLPSATTSEQHPGQ